MFHLPPAIAIDENIVIVINNATRESKRILNHLIDEYGQMDEWMVTIHPQF